MRSFFYFWLCHSTWLFCFSNILKIYAFSPNFPLAGSVIGGFSWLFLWIFKEIKHQSFSMTQPYFLLYIHSMLKIQFFSNSFAYGLHGWGILSVIPLGF